LRYSSFARRTTLFCQRASAVLLTQGREDGATLARLRRRREPIAFRCPFGPTSSFAGRESGTVRLRPGLTGGPKLCSGQERLAALGSASQPRSQPVRQSLRARLIIFLFFSGPAQGDGTTPFIRRFDADQTSELMGRGSCGWVDGGQRRIRADDARFLCSDLPVSHRTAG